MVTRSLIVVTRNRLHYLVPRIPLWEEALRRGDYIEVIVVDSSRPEIANKVGNLCRYAGFRHVLNKVPQWKDSRISSFNLGARTARGDWILITSDKMDVMFIDHGEFDRIAESSDFMMTSDAATTRIFRRAFFFELGGYDPRFVADEDVKITMEANTRGRLGNCETVYPYGKARAIESSADPIDISNRGWNHFRYGMSVLPAAFLIVPGRTWPGRTLLAEVLGTARLLRRGGLGVPYALCRALGWMICLPFYAYVCGRYGRLISRPRMEAAFFGD